MYFLRGLGDNEQFFIHSGAWNLVEDMREKGELGDFLIATAEGRSSFYIALNDTSVYAIRTTQCLVCSHKDRNAIEKAVLDGESLRNISKQFGPSPPTPCRHKSHIAQALALASEHRGIVLGESLLQKLDRMELDFARQRAELRGELPSAIIALREVRETLKVIHKMQQAVSEGDNSITVRIIDVGGGTVTEPIP